MDNKEASPDIEQLRGYMQRKQALADQLRLVRQGLAALGRQEALREIEALMVKLAEDRFVLAVVGQFKRGKSSLMNAIIGEELLPTGILPLTSAITVLHYGPKRMMTVTRAGLSFPDRRPLEELADFVTEKGNPGNARMVSSVRLELPVAFLRYGIEFVDTPGIGSTIAANTQTTYEFLPQCDAVLFVTAADSPMTNSELEFLRDLRPYVGKLFFIVNKIDLLNAGEKEEVRGYVTAVIKEVIGETGVKIFDISSREGLQAGLTKDAALYEKSGVMALEEELGAFLSQEKADYFLRVIMRRALTIIDKENDRGSFGEAALQARSVEIAQQKVKTMQQEPTLAARTLLQAKAKLELPGEALDQSAAAGASLVNQVHTAEVEGQTGLSAASSHATGFSEVPRENVPMTLEERGCPICAVIKKQVEDFLIHWQYELSSLEAAQALFADELGFCSLHSWQLVSLASPYGASVGYARLADTLAGRLRTDEMLIGKNIDRLRRDGQTCRVCGVAHDTETEAVERLAERLNAAEEQAAYRQSQGVCLKHLGLLMTRIESKELKRLLLSHEADRFARDAEDMRSYALKRDALRRGLQNSEEEDAYYRTIERLAGDSRVVGPWPLDGEI